ncbi:unnamed protein product, partial [Trichogramma brassicae]
MEITQIKVLDRYNTGKNAQVRLVSGGVKYNHSTLNFESIIGKGINYNIEVYGKALPKPTSISHNLIVGERTEGDVLAISENVDHPAIFGGSLNFSRPFKVGERYVITKIEALDSKTDGTGGYARVQSGGLKQNSVELRFKSKRGQDVYFTVRIYAKHQPTPTTVPLPVTLPREFQIGTRQTVPIVSTAAGVTPLFSAKRYSKQERNKVEVPFPRAISIYNSFMGGNDVHDGHCNYLLPTIRSKKWTIIFTQQTTAEKNHDYYDYYVEKNSMTKLLRPQGSGLVKNCIQNHASLYSSRGGICRCYRFNIPSYSAKTCRKLPPLLVPYNTNSSPKQRNTLNISRLINLEKLKVSRISTYMYLCCSSSYSIQSMHPSNLKFRLEYNLTMLYRSVCHGSSGAQSLNFIFDILFCFPRSDKKLQQFNENYSSIVANETGWQKTIEKFFYIIQLSGELTIHVPAVRIDRYNQRQKTAIQRSLCRAQESSDITIWRVDYPRSG